MFNQIESTRNLLRPYGLAALRIVLGIIFVQHGWWKVMNFDLSIQLFTKWGIPLPTLSTELAAATEILAGIALVLGIGVFYAALPLAFTLLVAIYFVHGPAGFWLPNGYEFALAMLVSVLAVGLSGPGALALQRVLTRRESTQPSEELRQAA